MVKAMDFESEGICVYARFPAQAIFKKKNYDDDGGERVPRVSTCFGMSAANVGASI